MKYSMEQIDYYGAISALDDAIGKIRELLLKYHVAHNIMLWFTSDNGPENSTPVVTAGLRRKKRSLYGAMISKNHKTDFSVMSNDLLSTSCVFQCQAITR